MGYEHKFAALVVLGLGMAAFGQATSPRKMPRGRKPPAAKPQPVAAQPAATPAQPPPPQRPDQMPARPPEVSYNNGQLSIVADNSTLSSILAAVRARTGAQVDIPPDASNDRVVVKLGPGNPRDVLASLLGGSRFNYIVLGSASDPGALSQIILTPHQGAGATPPMASTANQPAAAPAFGQPERPMRPIMGGAGRPELRSEEDEPAEPPEPVTPQPQPQEPAATVPPAGPPPGAEPTPPGAPGQANPNQPKTPEQFLQELQRMQQQQQNQQRQRQ